MGIEAGPGLTSPAIDPEERRLAQAQYPGEERRRPELVLTDQPAGGLDGAEFGNWGQAPISES